MGARPARAATPRELVIFDSDVLVWHLRGSAAARDLLQRTPYTGRLVPSIVVMELMRGCRNRAELRQLRRVLESAFEGVVHVSEEMSRRATTLVERYALSHRMWATDALIAATALTLKASLATGNVSDYRFVPGLRLLHFRQPRND